jgi:hypothetical protein
MQQPSAKAPRLFSHSAWRMCVDGESLIGFALGLIYSRIGGGVDDQLRLDVPDSGAQTVQIEQIATKLLRVGSRATPQRDYLAQRHQAALQLPTQLSIPTEKQYFHGCPA